MHATSISELRKTKLPGTGALAIVLAEDPVELTSTLAHNAEIGFDTQILIANPALNIEAPPNELVRVDHDFARRGAIEAAVNTVIDMAPGRWVYYGFNAEYLFYPFRETRSVGEMLAFHTEERRDAMLTYVVDLYANDLTKHPSAVSLAEAHLDRSGYYALARPDPKNHNHPKERQLDFFGGLRWRFEEHVPPSKRRIDRIGLFRAKSGLRLNEDHTFNDEEYNTYACAWHNNLTAAICSFRTAKALRLNAGSRHDIDTFAWHNTVPFDWSSQQLMDLGLMEPGQWF